VSVLDVPVGELNDLRSCFRTDIMGAGLGESLRDIRRMFFIRGSRRGRAFEMAD